MTIALALALGVVIGVLLGLLGGGGSILAVPALVYALGLGVELAIAISLIVIGVASAAGAVPKVRAGQVQWRLAGIFAAVGMPATLAGAAIGRHLSQPAIMLGFAVVMVIAGWRMLSDSAGTGTACEVGEDGINWRRCAPRSILSGVAVGLLTGLFGVGGGFLIIPALVLMLGVEMPIAVGTSLLIIVANSAAGLISDLPGVSIDWTIGSLIAGHFGTKLDTGRLQHWFGYLVFAVAAYVLVDTVFLHRSMA